MAVSVPYRNPISRKPRESAGNVWESYGFRMRNPAEKGARRIVRGQIEPGRDLGGSESFEEIHGEKDWLAEQVEREPSVPFEC